MIIDTFQIEAAFRRYQEREPYRQRNLRLIAAGRYLEVDSPQRVEKFLARHGFSRADATFFLRHAGRGTPAATEPVGWRREPYALERVLGTNDLMGVAFLGQNALRADSWNINSCLRGRLVGRLRHTCPV